MRFFIADLHQQTEQVREEKVASYGRMPFVVHREQGLSISAFEELQKNRGGLMSFKGFLQTSTKREASMMFAANSVVDPERVGILFVMIIDPNISYTPFADIQEVSYYRDEAEILFSKRKVFRIDMIQQMNKKGDHV